MNRENLSVPPADPMMAWILYDLDRLDEADEYPQTKLLTQEGVSVC